jgi:hypothetical protein
MATPATVIPQADFNDIATYYATARTNVQGASTYLLNACTTIVSSDVIEPNIDLLPTFYNTYLSIHYELVSDARYLSAVRAINNHVLQRTDFDDIDAYLEDTGATVPQGWADLSTQVGSTISVSNIA